jgi:ADP-ribosylglycohydrolase
MALSIVEILDTYGYIEQDALARSFARRYMEEPYRGYAGGAARLLRHIAGGGDWRELSPGLFGYGSYGNGAAMRVAPVGAYFSDDLYRAIHEARSSAIVTHAHPEGQAGAMAVAAAAALAAHRPHPSGHDFLHEILPLVPESITRDRIRKATEIHPDDLHEAILLLGSGNEVTAQDTVPFCLWSAAHRLECFEDALWWTAKGLGDCDTTCAIVGGIVALASAEIPPLWTARREPVKLTTE